MRVSWGSSGVITGPWSVRLHIEQHILAEAHVDMFPIMLRLAPSVARPVLALGIRLFHVDVLNISVERGKAPGNVFVVPFDDERNARSRYPRHVEASGLQVFFMPDVGDGMLQMHVVREHCLSAGGAGAAHCPFIGAGLAAIAPVRSQLENFSQAQQVFEARLRLVEGSFRNILLGSRQVGNRLRRRMIAPGGRGV